MDQSRSKYCCLLLSLINSRILFRADIFVRKTPLVLLPTILQTLPKLFTNAGNEVLTVTFRGHPSFVFLYRETSRSRLTSRQEFEWSRDGDKNRARSVDEARQLGHVTDHSTDVWRPLFRESLACVGATCACDRTFSCIFDD